jgi:murein DD-endopeptidase MepM/ murein hydrolase activator NlpD
MGAQAIARLFVLVAITSFALTAILTAAPAQAAPARPPFEVSFPQETDKTSFSNDWGARRSGGRRHGGNDLMAVAKMTEVYALADGVVTKINERSRPGRYISIEHAGGWESLYLHLNDDNIGTDDGKADWSLTLAPGIEEGAEVKAGQVIAWVGDSGNAEGTGPHTHFELSHDGHEINPYFALEGAFDRDLRNLNFKLRILMKGSGIS